MYSHNSKDRNVPLMSNHTEVKFRHRHFTPSLDEDQHLSNQNVAIHSSDYFVLQMIERIMLCRDLFSSVWPNPSWK